MIPVGESRHGYTDNEERMNGAKNLFGINLLASCSHLHKGNVLFRRKLVGGVHEEFRNLTLEASVQETTQHRKEVGFTLNAQ